MSTHPFDLVQPLHVEGVDVVSTWIVRLRQRRGNGMIHLEWKRIAELRFDIGRGMRALWVGFAPTRKTFVLGAGCIFFVERFV